MSPAAARHSAHETRACDLFLHHHITQLQPALGWFRIIFHLQMIHQVTGCNTENMTSLWWTMNIVTCFCLMCVMLLHIIFCVCHLLYSVCVCVCVCVLKCATNMCAMLCFTVLCCVCVARRVYDLFDGSVDTGPKHLEWPFSPNCKQLKGHKTKPLVR